MVVYPNAKINLGLNVVQKRTDGFHELETVFYPIPLCDILEIVPNTSDKVKFSSSGIAIPNGNSKNLVEKAYDLLKEDFDIPFVDIHLHKVIPIGAGLGGGSADASFALTTLNELFELQLSLDQLEKYAIQLGSDCPFFIKNKPVYATGKGEEFHEFDFSIKGKKMVLIYPNVHVSTADAYNGIVPMKSEKDIRFVLNSDIINWKNDLRNDFEKSVFLKNPLLQEYKDDLYKKGAEYACMSGSGSSIFGLFSSSVNLHFPPNVQYWTFELE